VWRTVPGRAEDPPLHLIVLQSVALVVRLVFHLLYLITADRKLIIGWLWKVVMKCDLCNADHREPQQKLCQPCIEAVARIWTLVSTPGSSIRAAGDGVDERTKSRPAAMVARPLSVFLL
jgi:hypothetical protein